MRDVADIERFYEEILHEINYLCTIDNDQELPYWIGIRDTLKWVLDETSEDFVFRDELELNKNGRDV